MGFSFLLHLQKMKKKKILISLTFMIAVLFSMLFQSFHSYEHFEKELSQKQCHHKYNITNAEITHQHHNFDHCLVCEFTFLSFISPEKALFQLYTDHQEIPYFFTAKETVSPFSGSLYSHRGPPTTIV